MAEPATATPAMLVNSKKPFLNETRRSRITAYTFISPFFILFAIFGLYPILFTIYLSFFKWDALGPMKDGGFKNYHFIIADPTFWISFSNTLLIMALMGTVPQLILALFV